MTLNPTAKNTVPRLECHPCDISEISIPIKDSIRLTAFAL